MIGCMSLLAESGIPRTQSGRAGSGIGPKPAVDCPQQHYTYAVDLRLHLRHRSWSPCGRVRCHTAGPHHGPGPGRALSSATAPGRSRGRARCRAPRPGPWAAIRAARWCAGSPEHIANGSPAPVVAGRYGTVGRIAGPGLPRVDHWEPMSVRTTCAHAVNPQLRSFKLGRPKGRSWSQRAGPSASPADARQRCPLGPPKGQSKDLHECSLPHQPRAVCCTCIPYIHLGVNHVTVSSLQALSLLLRSLLAHIFFQP
jgi:hypothetical protein